MYKTGMNCSDRSNSNGFSLIELMVSIVILLVLMGLVFYSFIPVMNINTNQVKTAETRMETGSGLDLLRSDLEHAGFGLPWSFPSGGTPAPYIEPAPLDDDNPVAPPRAIISQEGTGMNGADYLVIKGMSVARNATSQKWGLVGRDASHNVAVQSMGSEVFNGTDRVVVLRPSADTSENRQLILNGVLNNYFARPTALPLDSFAPPGTPNDPNGERYLLYGLDGSDPRRPFNRTDYYINAPPPAPNGLALPGHCAPGTGTFVKATLNQNNDNFTVMPVVDCVADFQVVYYLDTNGDGAWDTRDDANGLNGLSAEQIRNQVKFVRCYILSHEGGMDGKYTHLNANILVGELLADGSGLVDASTGSNYDLTAHGANWANYRWKVYAIVVTPKNLL